MPRGHCGQLRQPALEVRRRVVDDVAGDADEVRIERVHARDRLPHQRYIRHRPEMQVAHVDEADAGACWGEAIEHEGVLADAEVPIPEPVPVDDEEDACQHAGHGGHGEAHAAAARRGGHQHRSCLGVRAEAGGEPPAEGRDAERAGGREEGERRGTHEAPEAVERSRPRRVAPVGEQRKPEDARRRGPGHQRRKPRDRLSCQRARGRQERSDGHTSGERVRPEEPVEEEAKQHEGRCDPPEARRATA
jgi:hypothetical protein